MFRGLCKCWDAKSDVGMRNQVNYVEESYEKKLKTVC